MQSSLECLSTHCLRRFLVARRGPFVGISIRGTVQLEGGGLPASFFTIVRSVVFSEGPLPVQRIRGRVADGGSFTIGCLACRSFQCQLHRASGKRLRESNAVRRGTLTIVLSNKPGTIDGLVRDSGGGELKDGGSAVAKATARWRCKWRGPGIRSRIKMIAINSRRCPRENILLRRFRRSRQDSCRALTLCADSTPKRRARSWRRERRIRSKRRSWLPRDWQPKLLDCRSGTPCAVTFMTEVKI
jgi:hypothetical protein